MNIPQCLSPEEWVAWVLAREHIMELRSMWVDADSIWVSQVSSSVYPSARFVYCPTGLAKQHQVVCDSHAMKLEDCLRALETHRYGLFESFRRDPRSEANGDIVFLTDNPPKRRLAALPPVRYVT